MNHKLKRRGRPTGDGIDDTTMLAQIADLIFSGAFAKPTPAALRINPVASEADIRRWQEKWKARKETLLADAHRRADAKAAAEQAKTALVAANGRPATAKLFLASKVMRAQAIFDHPLSQQARALQSNHIMHSVWDIQRRLHEMMGTGLGAHNLLASHVAIRETSLLASKVTENQRRIMESINQRWFGK